MASRAAYNCACTWCVEDRRTDVQEFEQKQETKKKSAYVGTQ